MSGEAPRNVPTSEPPARTTPIGRLAGIAICAGIIAAAASSSLRQTDPMVDRPQPLIAPPREIISVPVIEPGGTGMRFARVFDVSAFRRGNIHTHSNRSDGDSDPADVYAWYRDHGYDFVAVTDHNTFTDPADYKVQSGSDFVVIGGEEVTMIGAGRQVHMNALCTDRRLPGGKFATVSGALAYGVGEIRKSGGIALVNHPNFTWGIGPSDLPSALGAQLLEIHSGHPQVRSQGNPSHPSCEALWDMALTAGLDFMGVAVDDAHHLRHPNRVRLSHPGRAWVEVFSDSLDANAICDSLGRGMLYASTGPSLARIAVTDDTYAIWPTDADAVVEFVGIGGKLLASKKFRPGDASASYQLQGTEGYVRARVSDGAGHTAWTPAVRVVGAPRNASASDRLAGAPPPG